MQMATNFKRVTSGWRGWFRAFAARYLVLSKGSARCQPLDVSTLVWLGHLKKL